MTIKELRTAKEMTQAAFAAAIGLSASAIAKVEAGRAKPSENMIGKIRDVFGVDLNAPEAKPAPAKKTGKKKEAAPIKTSAPAIIIQSVMGGEITIDQIMARIAEHVGQVDKVYIKPEENGAYWVKGSESGCINLW